MLVLKYIFIMLTLFLWGCPNENLDEEDAEAGVQNLDDGVAADEEETHLDDTEDNVEPDDSEPEPCIYPVSNPDPTDYLDVMPNIIWENAYLPAATSDGERARGPFSFEQFFCDEAYASYESMTLIMVTDWCPFCPGFMDLVESRKQALADANSLVVWIDLENIALGRASTEQAHTKVSNHASRDHGIIVGIADANLPDVFDGFWEGAPYGATIRKRDMKVVAKENLYDAFEARMVDIAENPERGWEPQLDRAQGLDVDGFRATCSLNDEERSEPNDDFIDAEPIQEGVWSGGICQQPPVDTYYLGAGNWSFRLDYDTDFGLLALEAYTDIEDVEPLRSDTQSGIEMLEAEGPIYLRVRTGEGAISGGPYILGVSNHASET